MNQYWIMIALLGIVDGGIINGNKAIQSMKFKEDFVVRLPDDFPNRCKDLQAPCSCSDIVTTMRTKDTAFEMVEHVCSNERRIEPPGFVCVQQQKYKYVSKDEDPVPYRTGCELRYATIDADDNSSDNLAGSKRV